MPFDLFSGCDLQGDVPSRGDHEGTFPTIEGAMARAAEIADDAFCIYEGERLVKTALGRYLRAPGDDHPERHLVWTDHAWSGAR